MYPTTQPNWQSLVKSRLRQTLQLYLWVFVPMWLMFLLNNSVLFGLWNVFGIVPRELSVPSFIGILASWTMHANLAHITGNSLVMAQVLFLFGVFEKKAMMTIVFLIVGSGLFTWVFGSSNSLHIGASGLAFWGIWVGICDDGLYDWWGVVRQTLELSDCMCGVRCGVLVGDVEQSYATSGRVLCWAFGGIVDRHWGWGKYSSFVFTESVVAVISVQNYPMVVLRQR